MTSVKGTRLDDARLKNEDGFVALGCDIVKYDKRYEGIVRYLLGRICIAEDIDAASRIAKNNGYKFRIVTPDGQVVNAGGSYTGGSTSKSTGILTRKNEIEKLERSKAQLEEQSAKAFEEKEKYQNEANKLAADIEGIKEQLGILGEEYIYQSLRESAKACIRGSAGACQRQGLFCVNYQRRSLFSTERIRQTTSVLYPRGLRIVSKQSPTRKVSWQDIR